jgi:hypothetical protein
MINSLASGVKVWNSEKVGVRGKTARPVIWWNWALKRQETERESIKLRLQRSNRYRYEIRSECYLVVPAHPEQTVSKPGKCSRLRQVLII